MYGIQIVHDIGQLWHINTAIADAVREDKLMKNQMALGSTKDVTAATIEEHRYKSSLQVGSLITNYLLLFIN